MAVKKTAKKKDEPAAPAKVEATESTPKQAAKPKAKKAEVAAAPAPAPEPAPEAKTTKARAPKAKASAAKAPEPKAAAKPVAAPAEAKPKAKGKAPAKPTEPEAPAPVETKAKPAQDKAAVKKAAPAVKLTDSQSELLKKIGEAPEDGYSVGKKVEERSIKALLDRKLIKKGAKDKASGSLRYQISSAGKKHLSP